MVEVKCKTVLEYAKCILNPMVTNHFHVTGNHRTFCPVQDAVKHSHFLSLLKKATVVAETSETIILASVNFSIPLLSNEIMNGFTSGMVKSENYK